MPFVEVGSVAGPLQYSVQAGVSPVVNILCYTS